MELNRRFSNSLSYIFAHVASGTCYRLTDELSLENNNVFSRSLIININSDEVEVPVIARNLYEERIYRSIRYPYANRVEKIILPLYTNCSSVRTRTFDSTIIQMFSTNYDSRLRMVITGKDDIYYGGSGIIFDADFTPLLLCTLAARKVQEQGETHMVYYRPVCHINPKVFMYPNEMVNKGIIKKIIPFFSNTEVFLPSLDEFSANFESEKVKVIVDNFDNFFIKPVKPTPSTCSNDILNQCLVDNIEDIMMLI